eukprot:scaffold1999_cov153-Amphora_coffeaeformis.AAC.12
MVSPIAAATAAAVAADRHKKFYLCAAPRPPDFEELTESVISGFGSLHKAEQVLEKTLDRIQNQHQWQRKSGPGRKSNAEHAIHFYEHVLDELRARTAAAKEESEEKEDEEGTEDNNEADDDNEKEEDDNNEEEEESVEVEDQEEEEEKPTTKEDEQSSKEHDEEESIQEEENPSPSPAKSASTSDTPQKNSSDQCNVCNDTEGRLVVCSSCKLAFHLPCYRPVMEEFPTDPDWRCAYCWLATEPKNSKKRRESAAAVRLMARLRNGNKRRKARQSHEGLNRGGHRKDQEKNERADTEKKEPPAASGNEAKTTGDAKTSPNRSPAAENVKKRKLALLKLADAFTGEIPSPDDEAGRGKRSRKQPTLYDPQMSVPARSWQSDEVGHSDESDSEDEESESTSTRRTVPDGDVYCGFCNDDPQIKLCCFCGCRKCFGKHKKAKLLICDECDEEYHTFCLSPPLDKLPSKKWFCPTCEKKGTTASSDSKTVRSNREAAPPAATVSTTPPAERKSSRKPPQPAEPVVAPPPLQVPIKRGRGRPPKNPEAIAAAAAKFAAMAAAASQAKQQQKSPLKRKRGRPPKSASLQSQQVTTKTVEIRSPDPVATVIHVSRSGRAVKRTSFHDEIDQSEQHLRSERNSFGNQSEMDVGQISGLTKDVAAPNTESLYSTTGSNTPPGTYPAAQDLRASVGESVNQAAGVFSSSTNPVSNPSQMANISSTPTTQQSAISTPLHSASTLPMHGASVVAGKSVPSVPQASTAAAAAALSSGGHTAGTDGDVKVPRRKPGARECVQISRRFGNRVIPQKYSEILFDYCSRGKVEHLIRMRERLDEHARYLELQLAGLEQLVKEKGQSNVTVPVLPEGPDRKLERTIAGEGFEG